DAIEARDLERVDGREQTGAQLGREPAGDLGVDDLAIGEAKLEDRAGLIARAAPAILAEAAPRDRHDALAQQIEQRARGQAALALTRRDPRDPPRGRRL